MLDSTLIAAIVGAIATLLGTIAYLVVELRKERRERRRDAVTVDDAIAAATDASTFPYMSDARRVIVRITDMDGTQIIERTTVGLRPIAGAVLHACPAEASTTGQFDEFPHVIHSSRADTDIEGGIAADETYKYNVTFQSGLGPGDAPCTFTVRWSARGSTCVDAKDIAERYGKRGYDFHSEQISTPVDELELTIIWPTPGDYRAYPHVTFGTLDSVAVAERTRISPTFESTPASATMRVKSPKVGLRYMIAWRGLRSGPTI